MSVVLVAIFSAPQMSPSRIWALASIHISEGRQEGIEALAWSLVLRF